MAIASEIDYSPTSHKRQTSQPLSGYEVKVGFEHWVTYSAEQHKSHHGPIDLALEHTFSLVHYSLLSHWAAGMSSGSGTTTLSEKSRHLLDATSSFMAVDTRSLLI